MAEKNRSSRPGFPAVFRVVSLAMVATLAATDARAVVLDSQALCQLALSKAGSAYTASVLKALRTCSFAELSGRDPAACSGSVAQKDLSTATTRFDAIVTKSCGALSNEDLSAPRPAGLSLDAPLSSLQSRLRDRHDRIVQGLVDQLYATTGGGVPSAAALACQSALDRAAASEVSAAFKLIGGRCHGHEDRGHSVTGEVSHIVEACLDTEAPALDAAAAKLASKVNAACTTGALAELGACPGVTSSRTVDAVTGCILDRAKKAAAAAIAAEHGRDDPRVIGLIEARVTAAGKTIPASDADIVLVSEAGAVVGGATADADGHIDLFARPMERFFLCWNRSGQRSCSSVPVDVGLDTEFFASRVIDVPQGTNEAEIHGRLLRADGSPCFDAAASADFVLRGGVRVAPTAGGQAGQRFGVSPSGDFVVPVPTTVESSLRADCGAEHVVVDLGPSPDPTATADVHTTNHTPKNGSVAMTDSGGVPVTDPSTVQPGATIHLHADFADDDNDLLLYRWEVTGGDGQLASGTGGGGGGGAGGDSRHASGQDVDWSIGNSSGLHQVTLWASDGRGGIESLVAVLGPINVGPILLDPCITPIKLLKDLCAAGYTAAVPEPAGGRTEFLTRKYRNAEHNSPADACMYYNIVDPDCIDLNCDGVVDAGTDPMGKCKRMTLGGWWQKNGFDPVTGLGSDVVTAWYLNSNDLGFGREMHCRVTSWSSLAIEAPVDAAKSKDLFVNSLRADILASPQVQQWSRLFGLWPSTIACYVVNYTTDHCFKSPTNVPANADLAYQGQIDFVAHPSVNPPNAYGTVAMEFGPVEGFGEVGPITKFFGYDGHTASGKRLTSANLDGCGPKSVPELCMNCHGGDWPGDSSQNATVDTAVAGLLLPGNVLAGIDANDTAPLDAGFLLRRDLLEKLTREESGFSSFLPFDPDTYKFPAAASSASQAPSIRKLNQLVLYSKPKDPIRDLIKGWYGNNLLTGVFAPWRPSAWDDDGGQPGDESDLYDFVYAKACRGCHAAHYTFSSPLSFPSSSRICKDLSGNAGGTPTMPHAKLTYLNLWKSDYPQSLTMSTLETWLTASEPGFTSCD